MDPQVYKIIKKVHALLNEKQEATLSNTEIAYITGLLESSLTIFTDPDSPEPVDGIQPPRKPGLWERLTK